MAAIDKREFVIFCMEQAARFGANAHYLVSVAKLRSNISEGLRDGRMGPFGFTSTEWAEAVGSYRSTFRSERTARDISSWRDQCVVVAYIAGRVAKAGFVRYRRNLEAHELYLTQYSVDAAERDRVERALGKALDLTAPLIAQVGYELSEGRRFELTKLAPAGPMVKVNAPRSQTDLHLTSAKTQGIKSGQYRVWYGTNRRPKDPSDHSKGYSADRDDIVHYGSCAVFIPASHIIGSLGSPWWQRLLRGNDEKLKLLRVWSQPQKDYWASIAERWQFLEKADRHALIFVHGYNVSFEEAALRTAQIGYDLSINGTMSFFSWPSQGRVRDYPVDETAMEQSEKQLTQFLVDFAHKSGADTVHVIAHSMGNRGLLRAVTDIAQKAQRKSRKRFGQIILAAADVDQATFLADCSSYTKVANNTTLYVSSGDLAIRSSVWLHKFARVGFKPPVFVAPGIETVDVTKIDLSFLGHGYFAQARTVLEDIYQVVRYQHPAQRRFGLHRVETSTGYYWEIAR